MIKRFILLSFLCGLGFMALGQTEDQLVRETISDFIKGTVYNYPDTITSAFYPGTRMFLYNGTDSVFMMTSEEYAALYNRRPPGTKNNRINSIVSLDIVGDVAYAKLQVDIPYFGNRYHDLLLLKKILGEWKIVAKCTSAAPIPKTPQQMVAKPIKQTVIDGLKKPWSMAFLSENEVIIAEKEGGLVKIDLTSKERIMINGLPKDIAGKVKIDTSKHAWGVFPPFAHGQMHQYNAGLFQVLLDPDFDNNHFLYLSYAAEDKEQRSTTKVIRAKLANNTLEEMKTIFVAEPYSHGLFHYGGGMIFGQDGKLYITVGERNLFEHLNPVPPLSQDVTDKRGKIYRINPDGSIPEDNPDFGSKAVKGLFATGIRASQGLAIDPATHKIWFSEHGTNQGDELNILQPGANYGWPHVTTGTYRSQDYNPAIIPGTQFTDPVHFWSQTVAPTGLTFYTGRAFPQWQGNLIVPGLSKGSLWRMIIENDSVVAAEELFIDDRVRLRKAIMSPGGQLYLLTDDEDGKLIRLINGN
ncbi:PQQ-dependent sugar dehydrogenase [Fulvivirga ligni]|uniref:PQQ-dependent sugar dehydrogenase n=1 Tax=Fulvivirga ligni TaxID=2904246 RepID=UPI001F303B19|nr:PQQ-dependent sugar dehydrogenase [Fulvivirga ligni]UII22294.1 PQQ-dependent sugar dehydrogenase [Fulvivirga ligni]